MNVHFLPSLSVSEDLKKNMISGVCEGCHFSTLCYEEKNPYRDVGSPSSNLSVQASSRNLRTLKTGKLKWWFCLSQKTINKHELLWGRQIIETANSTVFRNLRTKLSESQFLDEGSCFPGFSGPKLAMSPLLLVLSHCSCVCLHFCPLWAGPSPGVVDSQPLRASQSPQGGREDFPSGH